MSLSKYEGFTIFPINLSSFQWDFKDKVKVLPFLTMVSFRVSLTKSTVKPSLETNLILE